MSPLASKRASALLLGSQPRALAFLTRAEFAQKLPGVNAKVVVIIPLKPDGVFAHAFSGDWLGRGFEHGQRTSSKSGRFARPASSFIALFVAHGARAGVTEKNKIVVGNVAVGPFNVHTRAGRKVHLYRLRIRGRSGRLKRGLHCFSIA